MPNAWWKNNNVDGRDKPTHYQPTSDGQGVVVPNSNDDGSSPEINVDSSSRKVVVDPDNPGGGFTIDYAALRGKTSQIQQAVGQAVASTGSTAGGPAASLATLKALSEKQASTPAESVPVKAPVAAKPRMSLIMDNERHVEARQEHVAAPQPPVAVPAPATTVRYNVDPVNEQRQPAESTYNLKDMADALGMPFLGGILTPLKPQVLVVFELPHGHISARYHAAIEGANCLILAYDTRYDQGVQFMPSASDKNLAVTITVAGPDGQPVRRKQIAAYMGMNFMLGCLDCLVLVPVSEPDAAGNGGNLQGMEADYDQAR